MSVERPIIQGRGLEKIFKLGKSDIHALRGIDLELYKGDYIALMGPSGSGKTTLLNILGCLDKPTKGKLIFEGNDVCELSENKLAELRSEKIGFVFQLAYLVPTMNTISNILLPLTFVSRRKYQDEQEEARRLLRLVDLEHRMHHRPNELSGGELQRVAIARALINDPLLLLCDEPTGNLDSITTEHIMALLDRLNKLGKTIFIVTHNRAVANHCKSIMKILDGKIIERI